MNQSLKNLENTMPDSTLSVDNQTLLTQTWQSLSYKLAQMMYT